MAFKNTLLCFSCCLITFLLSGNVLALKTLPNKKYFQLHELMGTNKFESKHFNGTWISGTEFIYTKSKEDGIFLYDMTSKKSTVFLSGDVMEKIKSEDIIVSPDRKFVLVQYDKYLDYLRVVLWRFAVYDIKNGKLTELANNHHIQYCEFFRDHSLLYNIDNNLIYIEDISVNPEPLPLTSDGIPGSVYNGVPDYIYGDVFYMGKKLTWTSKDGKWIVIAFFDDSNVAEETFFMYGLPNNSIDHQYPTTRQVRYPKPGKPQPTVYLKILNMNNTANLKWVTIEPPLELGNDPILASVTWASETELAVTWLSRPQNRSLLIICHVNTTKCTNILIQEETKGWIDVTTPVFSVKDPNIFLNLAPFLQNNYTEGEFTHIAKYTRGRNSSEQMTFGLLTVIEIVEWNEEADLIYYMRTMKDMPWKIHMFIAGSRNECISCDMMSPNGELCNAVESNFSPDKKYFALTCMTQAPFYTLLYDAQTAKPLMVWQDNEESRKIIDEYHLPQANFFRIPLPESDVFLKILLPPQFDPEDTDIKYPLIVHIYSGPSISQVVDTQFLDFEEFWSTNRSYIYTRIEGRGCRYKGNKVHFANYRNLGTVEIDDVINGTRYLLDTYPWIDKSRVGIWGWSYGGFASLQGLIRDHYNIYKCGVAVAPLTDLQEFLSMNIEAFMGMPTPEDNLKGYENANLFNHALKLRGKKFAVLVGNADNNMSHGKTLQFFNKLQRAGIDFEQMSYPDEAHLLLGALPHVYHFIDDFWLRCFSSSNLTGNTEWN